MAEQYYDDTTDVVHPAPPPVQDHESASKMPGEPPPEPDEAEGETDHPDGELQSVSIRKAENGGLIVNCSREEKSTGGPNASPAYSSKDYAFKTFDEMVNYLRAELA